jgi:hypothetical protein
LLLLIVEDGFMRALATTVFLLGLTVCSASSAFARDRYTHRHRPPIALSLPGPNHTAAPEANSASHSLGGQILSLRGPTADQQKLSSPLAVTMAAVRAIRRGLFTGAMRVYSGESPRRASLSWTAGGVPFSSLPTASSLNPYHHPVAERLPCDPAPVYRLTFFSVRF